MWYEAQAYNYSVTQHNSSVARLHTADVNPIPDKRSIAVYLSMYYLHFNGSKNEVSFEIVYS